MRVLERLESRRRHWQELEQLCGVMEGGGASSRRPRMFPASPICIARPAPTWPWPTPINCRRRRSSISINSSAAPTINSIATNRCTRAAGIRELFVNVPQRLFADGCLRLAFAIFWGVFLLCMFLAWRDPDFAPRIVGKEELLDLERRYSYEAFAPQADAQAAWAGFYIGHNATIGLRCFAFGLLAGIGGLYETVFNASTLGAEFGYMVRSAHAANFLHFVTAHGPFELTAIVLMAAAGMRLGFSMIDTGGRSRADAVYRAARRSVPVMSVGVVLFLLAAGIEAFVSPSAAPYAVKAGIAVLSAVMLLFYFLVLGYPGLQAMMLDNHQIVIRERGYLELLDLSLRALRSQAGPLFLALLAGVGPLVVLNAWLLNRAARGSGRRRTALDVPGLDADRRALGTAFGHRPGDDVPGPGAVQSAAGGRGRSPASSPSRCRSWSSTRSCSAAC